VRRWYEKTTWMYISVPLVLYVGERMLRALRSNAYTVKILKVSILCLILVMLKAALVQLASVLGKELADQGSNPGSSHLFRWGI